MGKATGIVEVFGLTAAFVAVDAGCKAANVTVETLDKNKPANADSVEVPLVMVVKFEGNAGAVQSALDAGVAEAERRGLYITSKVIAGLDPQVEWFANLTATGKDKFRNVDIGASDKKTKK